MATKQTESATKRKTRDTLAGVVLVALLAVAAVVGVSLIGGWHGAASKPAATGGAAAAGATPVDAQLGEMYIKLDTRSVPAGKVRFHVANIGKVMHEMVVIRTNTPAGRLPTNSAGEASEKGAAGEVSDLGPGRDEFLTLNLKPGHYALICNLPGHYKGGMFTNFTVR